MDTLALYVSAYLVVDVFCIIMATVIMRKVDQGFGSELEIHYFKHMIGYYLLFCLTDAMWMPINCALFGVDPIANVILSCINMIAMSFVGYFWFCYAQAMMRGFRLETVREMLVSQIPLAVLFVLCITNPATSWMFMTNDQGALVRGPLYYSFAVLTGIYAMFVCVQALAHARKATSKVQRAWLGTLMKFAIIPACSIVVDLFVPNTPVIALGALTAILFVFSSLQEARIFNDSLTGLNNRRRADMYLTDKIASVGKAGAVYVYVLDINLFKQINDTRGHMEGDHALQVVANGLRDAAGKSRGFVARWGGDEFVLVVDASATASPDEVVDVIDKSLALACRDAELPYSITVSTGYAVCTSPAESADDLIKRADQMLYEHKRARRQDTDGWQMDVPAVAV